MFSLLNMERSERSISTLTIKPYSYESSVTMFDMTLQCIEHEKSIYAHFEYADKLFKQSTIDRLIDSFRKRSV